LVPLRNCSSATTHTVTKGVAGAGSQSQHSHSEECPACVSPKAAMHMRMAVAQAISHV
jgi:hypothetical protein